MLFTDAELLHKGILTFGKLLCAPITANYNVLKARFVGSFVQNTTLMDEVAPIGSDTFLPTSGDNHSDILGHIATYKRAEMSEDLVLKLAGYLDKKAVLAMKCDAALSDLRVQAASWHSLYTCVSFLIQLDLWFWFPCPGNNFKSPNRVYITSVT